LCNALGDPALAAHRVGVADDALLQLRLEALFATRSSGEWIANPGLGGGVGPVHDTGDLLDDPHVTERGSLIPLEGTDLRVLANPVRFERATGDLSSNATTPPPSLGAHTDEVLVEAGFTADEVRQLHDTGVVA
jgi:alpha-methylacyl-CoA racemase